MSSSRYLLIIAAASLIFLSGCATSPSIALQPVDGRIPPTPPGVYDISKVSVIPVAVFQARPRYPVDLRRAGVSGEGVVSFIVGTEGNIENAVVVRATDVRFGEAARESIIQWRFRPAQLNGQIVPCHMMVPIVFTVNER
jgi:TonB family protein